MKKVELTNKQARKFLLLKQGLTGAYKFFSEEGICDYVKQAGCIQFDPIDICGKNAELVLQSRIKDFSKEMLYELLYTERKLIDYFDKNMSILSIEDWKYFSRKREYFKHHGRSKEEVNAVMNEIKAIIKERGFASSKDINLNKKVDWYWSSSSLSRAALETLYFQGELILHHKKGTIKYYALSEEHIPKELLNAKEPHQTEEEYLEWSILRRIGAVGILWNKPSDAWLGISGLKAANRNKIFNKLIKEGKIIEILIEGEVNPFYCLSEDEPLLNGVLSNDEFSSRTEFIAPLDNMLWDRKLIKRIFNFDYKWEIYTPIEERKYGYYVLPILSGDSFIGRIEMVNDKKSKQLVVKNLWWEDSVTSENELKHTVYECIERFSHFNNCQGIKLECSI
jgi:uncharacterized protein YcaQ